MGTNFIPSPVREQVRVEIIAALTASETPMTASQLMSVCPTSEDVNVLCQELNKMKKAGEIAEAEKIPTKTGPRKSYRIATDADRLHMHLEAELALDTASESHNGDEMHHVEIHPARIVERAMFTPIDQDQDPIIQAIQSMDAPRWIDGNMDAERLRELADWRPIKRNVAVSDWLLDLAGRIEEMVE